MWVWGESVAVENFFVVEEFWVVGVGVAIFL